MFRRKPIPTPTTVTRLELSDETRQALVALDSEIKVLTQLTAELNGRAASILAALMGEITAQIPSADPVDAAAEVGVQVFADEPPPDAMSQTVPANPRTGDAERIRDTPFTRAPRSTQVTWLRNVMADGAWYAAVAIAREYATDERHFRYMRAAVGGRLRELHEDGHAERRDSKVKGSMFEYRLIPQEEES